MRGPGERSRHRASLVWCAAQDLPAWDFRCKNVMSISASGHKFGQSVCGTGWVVWRQRKELSEHVAVSVSYLGGKVRAAAGPCVWGGAAGPGAGAMGRGGAAPDAASRAEM